MAEGIKFNSFGQNLMLEGSDNVKNNQNVYFLIRTTNESLMEGWIKLNSFGQNFMPEGSDNVKNN